MIGRGNICEDPRKWRRCSNGIHPSVKVPCQPPGDTHVSVTASREPWVPRGTNSLRLIGEAGTPCPGREMMSVHFRKEAVPCYVKTRTWAGSQTLAVQLWASWAEGFSLCFSYPANRAHVSWTQPSSGSTGKLIHLLFLTLQIRDRTEQEGPGILGTWQHYLHTIHNVLNTLKMFVFRSKFNTSSYNFVYTINSLSQPCLHGENRDNHAELLYNPASGKEVPSPQELVE